MRCGVWILSVVALSLTGCQMPFGDGSQASSGTTTPDGSTPAAASVLPPTTSEATMTTQAAAPAAIEETLVRNADDTSVATLLAPAGADPSPVDAEAVPWRPQVPCAVASQNTDDAQVELTGCQFDTIDAASDYVKQWNDAFAVANPVWHGQAAVTTPVDSVPGWTGRAMSTVLPDAEQATVRVDMVHQRGPRVYNIMTLSSGSEQEAATARAAAAAEAQQAFLDELGINDDTPPGASVEPQFVSVRYLTPTWSELTTAVPGLTGPKSESTWVGQPNDNGTPSWEIFRRVLTEPELDQWGSRSSFSATIERHRTVPEAQRSVLDDTGINCTQPAVPIDGSPGAIACTSSWRWVAAARHDNVTLTMEVPAGHDPAAAQQIFVQWNQRFIDLGLPPAGPSAPLDAPPRTASPLPTDAFPANGFDGSYLRTSVSASVADDGTYERAAASYTRGFRTGGLPYTEDEFELTIERADAEIKPWSASEQLVGTIGDVTPDAWTTVVWKHADDGLDGASLFDAVMLRLLPSGDRIALRNRFMLFYPAIDQPEPPFAADGPLLTSVWESLQGYSLSGFVLDPDDVVSARAAGNDVFRGLSLSSSEEAIVASAQVAPDSPPGAIAEWRGLFQGDPGGDGYYSTPAVERQLVAFGDEAGASAFVAATTAGIAMTPIDGVDGTEAAFGADAQLIVIRRGKWVLRISSPGRVSWNDGYESTENPIPIDRFARYAAEYFATSALI